MIEVKSAGIWIYQSVHDTYGTMHCRPRIDYSHIVKRFVDGPFEDMVRDGKNVLSAQKLAVTRLTELLADPSQEEMRRFLDKVSFSTD